MMDSTVSMPSSGNFQMFRMQVGSIMRELADRHDGRMGSASGLAAVTDFLTGRAFMARPATIRAAVRRR
jgi:hypothetical protein